MTNQTGTTLRITEAGEVYNPVFRFVSRFLMGHTRTLDAAAGEPIQPAD